MTFEELHAHPTLARAIAARGYAEPTPIQAAVLAPEHAGRDLVASSQTGSGKTVAFGLALAGALLGEAEALPRAEPKRPLALVIAPTRELAMQVARELGWLYAAAGAKVAACVGGMDPRRESIALAHGAHLVVGTPGRLVDHLERRNLDLSGLRGLVLDEADEMLDMGFREELERILRDAPAERQTILFSATIPPAIAALARQYTRDAVRIAASPARAAHADIAYRAHLIAPRDREHALVNTLRFIDPPSALVFVNTREGVTRLAASLAERGFQVVALSGELTQAERSRALTQLRDGRARVLVATDVAARGLDLPDVSLVVHADLPRDAQVLQHRSGRTGRAGRKGAAVLLVPASQRRVAERLLREAGIRAPFTPPPSAEDVRKEDRARLLSALRTLADEDASEDDLAIADQLLETRPGRSLVAALVRREREAKPAPEELAETRALPAAPAEPARSQKKPRAIASGEGAWFRVNLGREKNADPKWILPLVCRLGGVTRTEIGKIVVEPGQTRFEVAHDAAAAFEKRARAQTEDPRVKIERQFPRPKGKPRP